MIESVESHTETKIITTREGQLDALGSPFLKRVAILDDDTLLATFIKKEIDLDRPVAIGVTILERSKALMYSFLYEGKMIFWEWSLSLYLSPPVIYPYFKGPKACQPMYMDTWVSSFLPSLTWSASSNKRLLMYFSRDSFILRVYTEDLDKDIHNLQSVIDTCASVLSCW